MNESDRVVPFLIHESNARGRAVRLHDAVDRIIAQHDYPQAVSRLLAEAVGITAMLSTNLKTDGVLSLQLQSKGPVTMLVVDAAHGGALRGYADVDADRLAEIVEDTSLEQLFSEGYLAMTLDPGEGLERYQGVVALEGTSLAQVIESYYRQSQQTEMWIRLAVGHYAGGADTPKGWVAGGLYLERMPLENDQEDRWEHHLTLAKTIRDDELLDTALPLSDMLHRLFHEDGVWVYEPHSLEAKCRCSREKMIAALMILSEKERVDSAKDGVIEMHCHFCNRCERIALDELESPASG